MKKHIFCLLLASLPALAYSSTVAADFDPSLERGLEVLYRGDYEAAEAVFDSFISIHPDNPAGWFFKAGLYQVRMTDQECDSWAGQYNRHLDSAMALSNLAVGRNPKDAWARFIRGGTYGYLAARDGRAKKYLSALNHGLAAVSEMKKAAELDPGLYDAYLGIGSYHYFRTRAVSVLKWLPFIGDNRDKGIGQIELSIAKGRYTNVMGRNGLVWILIDYGKYQRALSLAEGLERDFPANPFFFWARPEIFWRTKQWAKAAEGYRRLLRLIESRPIFSNYNRVMVRYRLAKCLYESGEYREAAALAQEALNIPSDQAMVSRLVMERRHCREIIQKSREKLKD
jgi:tetratricopeptide (TPR) repeat protein